MDIVDKLKAESRQVHPYSIDLAKAAKDAATEITQLREQVEVMRVALEQCAFWLDGFDSSLGDWARSKAKEARND